MTLFMSGSYFKNVDAVKLKNAPGRPVIETFLKADQFLYHDGAILPHWCDLSTGETDLP